MEPDPTSPVVREAVGVFETAETMQAAIDELLRTGFDRAELSLLAATEAVEDKLGHVYRKVAEVEDDPEVPRTCYVAPESIGEAEGALAGGLLYVGAVAAAGAIVASGGALAVVIAGAAIAGGVGGLIGAVLARLIDKHQARLLHEHLDRGGLLLWVRTRDADHEARASAILKRHSGHDVHIHALPAA